MSGKDKFKMMVRPEGENRYYVAKDPERKYRRNYVSGYNKASNYAHVETLAGMGEEYYMKRVGKKRGRKHPTSEGKNFWKFEGEFWQ